jgi:alpha-beta hydrolase superfamily lysophospholipase
VQSIALWLGSHDRPLFAWLDFPVGGLVAGAAVVCPTVGLESEYSARAIRDLAHRLAASGWAALRIDYAGTGDSAGTWTDPDLVSEWLCGVRGAVEYARSLGAPRVAVVGLRLGATLAAAELARGGGVDDLVLWDPCATGKAFLREQRVLSALWRDLALQGGTLRKGEVLGSGEPIEDGSVEGPGALFSAATVSALELLAIAPGDRSLALRELVLPRQGRRLEPLLAQRQMLPHVESAEVSGQEALLNEHAITPGPTLDRIVSWLTEPGGPVRRLDVPEGQGAALHQTNGGPGVLEQPVELGPAHLFGMLSEPKDHFDPSAPTVVFLSVGRITHHGPGRLWVDLARSWAASGLRCLRVDLSGIGDSPTRPGRTELVVYPADAPEDMRDIRRAASVEGSTELIFVGLCSGSAHAIDAALAEPVAAVCMVNPVFIHARWGEQAPRVFEPDQESSSEPGDRQSWRATRPWVSRAMKRFARFRDVTRWMPNVGWWVVNRWFLTSSPARTLERLTQSGVDVLVVAGTQEARRVYRGDQRRLRAMISKGCLTMEVVPNLEHSLFERSGRERVSKILDAYVLARAAHVGGTGSPTRGVASQDGLSSWLRGAASDRHGASP